MAVQPIASEDHVDVLIVGAGISGIGVAHYLQKELPSKSYLILESRQSLGGTWDLFRYPGIRSDSDLHTYAYEFKPWRSRRAIAGGDEIMAYLREAVAEDGIDRQIRYGHKVCSAAWSSQDARWTVEVELQGSGQRKTITCSWLFAASGYYRYDQGYTPAFPGLERFKGPVVHPQQWPEKLDYRNKRVVIIGSGATAVTLLPALAEQAQHVTMLQRTPTYVVSLPGSDPIANLFNKVLPAKWAYAATRYKNVRIQRVSYHLCQTYPNFMRWLIRLGNKKMLPDGYPVDVHFKPPYNPWDQRLCAVPDGDMFKAIKKGKASVVTDHIETFTETGIRLKSGQELPADIVVPATGFSIGVSRLQAALTMIGKLDTRPETGPVVVVVMDRNAIVQYQTFVARLRTAGIRAELYLGNPKNNLGVQLKYADRRNSPCAVIQGGDEKARGEVQIKDLIVGAQIAAAGGESRDDYLQKQAEAQLVVKEGELVKAVRDVLARHDVTWFKT